MVVSLLPLQRDYRPRSVTRPEKSRNSLIVRIVGSAGQENRKAPDRAKGGDLKGCPSQDSNLKPAD